MKLRINRIFPRLYAVTFTLKSQIINAITQRGSGTLNNGKYTCGTPTHFSQLYTTWNRPRSVKNRKKYISSGNMANRVSLELKVVIQQDKRMVMIYL